MKPVLEHQIIVILVMHQNLGKKVEMIAIVWKIIRMMEPMNYAFLQEFAITPGFFYLFY